MPIALIIFGDKSHFDLNGALSTILISFTLSCFNESARNRVEFWRPLAYIPNLSYAKVGDQVVQKQETKESVEDKHRCIRVALKSLIEVHRRGGIATTFQDKTVILKVWIHYIIGDTQGKVGHYNGNGKLKHPY